MRTNRAAAKWAASGAPKQRDSIKHTERRYVAPKPLPDLNLLDPGDWTWSKTRWGESHPAERCEERGIGVYEVYATLQFPDGTIKTGMSERYQRGDVIVAVDSERREIVTVISINKGHPRKPLVPEVPMQLAEIMKPEQKDLLMAIGKPPAQDTTEPEHINGIPVIKNFYTDTRISEYVDQQIRNTKPGGTIDLTSFAHDLEPLLPYFNGDVKKIREALSGTFAGRVKKGVVLPPDTYRGPWRIPAAAIPKPSPPPSEDPMPLTLVPDNPDSGTKTVLDGIKQAYDKQDTPPPAQDLTALDKPAEPQLPEPHVLHAVPLDYTDRHARKDIRTRLSTVVEMLASAGVDYEYSGSRKAFTLQIFWEDNPT